MTRKDSNCFIRNSTSFIVKREWKKREKSFENGTRGRVADVNK